MTKTTFGQRSERRRVFLPIGVDEEWRTSVPRLLKGTARRIPLADGRIQCIVTSPPYWGQEAYSGSQDEIENQLNTTLTGICVKFGLIIF
jgi:hypothetical protein